MHAISMTVPPYESYISNHHNVNILINKNFLLPCIVSFLNTQVTIYLLNKNIIEHTMIEGLQTA